MDNTSSKLSLLTDVHVAMNALLPDMQTDIMLSKDELTLIIDAKYYSHTIQTHFDMRTLHLGNLYPMFTYVIYPCYTIYTLSLQETLSIRQKCYFNLEEFYNFRNGIEDEIDLIAFDLLYWCGIRKKELMTLKFPDFDILNRSIHILKSYDNRNRIITSPKSRSSFREIILVKHLFDIPHSYTEKSEQLDYFNPNLYLIGLDPPISSTTLERRKNKYCRLAQVQQI